jgi:hypothetical protein
MWKYIKPTTKPFVQLGCPASTVTLANSSDKHRIQPVGDDLINPPILLPSNASIVKYVHVFPCPCVSIYIHLHLLYICLSLHYLNRMILNMYYPIWFTTSTPIFGTSGKKKQRFILIPAAMFYPHVETKRPSTSNLYINIFLFWFVLPHCWRYQDRCFDTSPTLSHWNLSTLYIYKCMYAYLCIIFILHKWYANNFMPSKFKVHVTTLCLNTLKYYPSKSI